MVKFFDESLTTSEIVAMLSERNWSLEPTKLSLSCIAERIESWDRVNRRLYDDTERRVLAIKTHLENGGKIPPLIVCRLVEGGYSILSGWHRASALLELSAEDICAYAITYGKKPMAEGGSKN